MIHLFLAASPIQYKIISGNAGGAFGINNATGLIFIANALDYEKIKKVSISYHSNNHDNIITITNFITNIISSVSLQYELKITASDNFKENYTTVVIIVRDVNDNSPIFEKTSYKTQITEEDDRGLPKRVLKVSSVSIFKRKSFEEI
jgi:hypothetical protein